MAIIKIPDGNAFKLRVTAMVNDVPAALNVVNNIIVNFVRRGRIAQPFGIDGNGRLVIANDGSLARGLYGVELTGYHDGKPWRHYIKNAFKIVDENEDADTPTVVDDVPVYDLSDNMSFGGDGVTAAYVDAAIEAHNEDNEAHEALQAKMAGKVDDVLVDGESVVETDPVTGKRIVGFRKDQFGKVDDVKVNGESVLNENNEAEITVPTKTSELDNDEDFATNDDVDEKVAAHMVNEVNVSVDNTAPTGQPSAEKTFQDGVLGITFKNVKGEKGDKLQFSDLTEAEKASLKGQQGDSAVWDSSSPETPPDFVMANGLGDSTTKSMTQKAVTAVVAPMKEKVDNMFNTVDVETLTWTDARYMKNTNNKVELVATAGNSVAKIGVDDTYLVKFKAGKKNGNSGQHIIWAFADASDNILKCSDSYSYSTAVSLTEFSEAVPTAAKYLYISANTNDKSSVTAQKADFLPPPNVQKVMDYVEQIGEPYGARISSIEKYLNGVKVTGFTANICKVQSTGQTHAANFYGYAMGPVMKLANYSGKMEFKISTSYKTLWINIYDVAAPSASTRSIANFTMQGRTIDIDAIKEQYTEAKSIVLSVCQNQTSTELSQEVVSGWSIESMESLKDELASITSDIETLQEDVAQISGTTKKATFHYVTANDGYSYITGNLTASKKIRASFQIKRTGVHLTTNPNFNYTVVKTISGSTETSVHGMTDEIAAEYFNMSFMGGNHGDSAIRLLTCANHGKTYQDIGSIWSFGTSNFTILSIEDSNTLCVIGENLYTYPLWRYNAINVGQSGTLTHVSGATNTEDIVFTNTAIGMLRVAMIMSGQHVYVDGKEVTQDGNYDFDKLEICENYDILNTADIVAAIRENVGTFTANPDFTQLGAAKTVRNSIVYTFIGADLWFVNKTMTFLQNVFIQADDWSGFMMGQIISGSSPKLYIPKALPVNGKDFRSIINFASSDITTDIKITEDKWEVPDSPPDRYVQYSDLIGYSSGFIFDYGIGGSRKNLVTNAFMIPTTRKVYPVGITGKASHNAGDSYSAVAYRRYFDPSQINKNGTICCTTFEYDNKLYIYADYNAAGIYDIEIPAKFLGKNIEVHEKSDNVSLLNHVSASAIQVKVTMGNEDVYGYIVAQIK